jgi:hypothetical protein
MVTTVFELPQEVLEKVFSSLDYKSLSSAEQVCSWWRELLCFCG